MLSLTNMKKVTQKDIAAKLGISVMTVSRVVNNHKNVSPKTREKVLNLIKKENYFLNSIAKALRTNKIYSVGVIIRYTGNIFTIPYFNQLLEGIQDVCIEKNYDLTISPFGESKFEYQRIISARKADCYIIFAPGINDVDIKYLVKTTFLPFVIINNYGDFNYVAVDSFKGAYEMTKYLIKCGYRKIGFIKGLPYVQDSLDKYNGYIKALEEENISVDHQIIFEGGYGTEDGIAVAEKIIQSNIKIDAIFASNDMMAIGLIKQLQKYKIKIPDDIAVAGFDNIEQSEYIIPSLTTVDQQIRLIGATATKLLIEATENSSNKQHRKKFFQIKISPKLIIRESTKKLV